MPDRVNPFHKGDRVRGVSWINWRKAWQGVVSAEPDGPNRTQVLFDGELLPHILNADHVELVPDDSGDASRTVMGQGAR